LWASKKEEGDQPQREETEDGVTGEVPNKTTLKGNTESNPTKGPRHRIE